MSKNYGAFNNLVDTAPVSAPVASTPTKQGTQKSYGSFDSLVTASPDVVDANHPDVQSAMGNIMKITQPDNGNDAPVTFPKFDAVLPKVKGYGEDKIIRTTADIQNNTDYSKVGKFEKYAKEIGGGFIQGILQTPKAIDDLVDLIKKQPLNNNNWTDKLSRTGELLNQGITSEVTKNLTFADQLAGGVGSMGSFLIPSTGFGKLASGTTKLVQLFKGSEKTAEFVAKLTAQTSMTALESSMEAGSVYDTKYNDVYDKTGDVTKATNEATKMAENTAISNGILLGLTNKFAGYFEHLDGGVKNTIKRVLSAYLSEGSQEGGQQIISNLATDKPWSEGVKDSALIGGIIGSGATLATADVFNSDGTVDKKKVEDIVAKTQETKATILNAQKDGISTDEIVSSIAEKNGISIPEAQTIVDSTMNTIDVPSQEDFTKRESSLVSDVKDAIANGSRISAITSAITDQYGIPQSYASTIVQKALSEQSIATEQTNPTAQVDTSVPDVVDPIQQKINDLQEKIPTMKAGSVEKKNAKIELETERAKLRTLKQEEQPLSVKPVKVKPVVDTKVKVEQNPLKQSLLDILEKRKTQHGYKSSDAKGDALKYSALIRGMEGRVTGTEMRNAEKFLSSAYVGKKVTIDGKTGIIQKTPSFGNTKVKFEDGTEQTVAVNSLKDKKVTEKDIVEHIKQESTKTAEEQVKLFGAKKEENKPISTKKSPKEVISSEKEGKVKKTLPKNLKVTDAYSKSYLGFNLKAMEEKANQVGYNLYDAMVTKVDSKETADEKVVALNEILNEIVAKDENNNSATNDTQYKMKTGIKAVTGLDQVRINYFASKMDNEDAKVLEDYLSTYQEKQLFPPKKDELLTKEEVKTIEYFTEGLKLFDKKPDQIASISSALLDQYYNNNPVYKYKSETLKNGIPTVSGAFLEDASKRLKIQFDYKFFDAILGQQKKEAWGVTRGSAIALDKNAPFITERHEFVHLTLKNLDKIDVLKHLTRSDILIEQAKKMGLPIEMWESYQVEEALAQGIEQYKKGDIKLEPKSKIREFYDYLIDQFGKFLKAIKVSKGDVIKNYYDILLYEESVNDQYVKLSTGNEFTNFIKDNVLDLSNDTNFETSEYTMMKDKLVEVENQYNQLVTSIKENQEIMSVISKYVNPNDVSEIEQATKDQLEQYVKAVLEIQHIKQEIKDASKQFKKLVTQRENIEDLQSALENKLIVITTKTHMTGNRNTDTSVTVVANTIAKEFNQQKTTITAPEEVVKRMYPAKKTTKNPFGNNEKKVSSFQHRMLDLLQEQNRDDVQYNVMHKVQEVAKAEAYYDANKERTINMAIGTEPVPQDVSSNVIALTVLQKAKEAGDYKTIAKVLPKLSLRATAQGQEIAMLANAFGERDPISYMNKLIAQRKALAKKKYKPLFSSSDSAKNFEEVVKEKVAVARKRAPKLKELLEVKAEEIDSFLDDLKC